MAQVAGFPILHQRPANSEGGEVNKSILLVSMNGKAIDHVRNVIVEALPAEHCEHSYDCCGQWYQSTPDVSEFRPNIAKVVITHRINC